MSEATKHDTDKELETMLDDAENALGEDSEVIAAARAAVRTVEAGAKNVLTGAVNSTGLKTMLLDWWNGGGQRQLRENMANQGYQQAIRLAGVAVRELLFGYMEKFTASTPWAHKWVTNKIFRTTLLGLFAVFSANMLYTWEQRQIELGKHKSANAIGCMADIVAEMLVQEGVNLFNIETVMVEFIHGLLGKITEESGSADLNTLLDARQQGKQTKVMGAHPNKK